MITNDGCVVTNGNVVLVDPNCVNTEVGLVNEIPPYENMHIYADLVATRKGRTVLQVGKPISSDSTVTINMMGFNQNSETSNENMFTTNYYDGSTGEEKQYESFGIENIKITINSSFIPQVNISFIDVRGLSFFNEQPDGEDSPYRILFDFPPPIFRLTLKGYYGKAVSYELHLTKYNTEFKSDTGNFYIDAQFVALTFAPLADILFRYVINFPLIRENVSPDTENPPINTFDLITKVRKLNHANNLFENTDIDNDIYDELIKNESAYVNTINMLNMAKTSQYIVDSSNKNVMFLIYDESEETKDVVEKNPYREINSVSDFNSIILSQQKAGVETSPNIRLYIAFQLGSDDILNSSDDSAESIKEIYRLNFEDISPAYSRRIDHHKKILNDYRKQLIRIASNNIKNVNSRIFENRIGLAQHRRSNYGLNGYTEQTIYTYVYLDVTDFYGYLYKDIVLVREEKTDIINELNTKINNMILEQLGMKPTIYNIFKLILDDVDKMFDILRETAEEAENHHKIYKNQIIDFNYRDVGENDRNNAYIYPYPLVIDNAIKDGVKREERVAPIKVSESLGNDPFPELVLIRDFIDTFRRQSNIARQLNLKLLQNVDGSYKWIPLSPFDSKINSTTISTPYLGIDTGGATLESRPTPLFSDDKIVQIMEIVLKRFYVLTQYVYPFTYEKSISGGDSETSNALMNLFSRSEAINLSVSITNPELRNLILDFSKRYRNNVEDFNSFLNNFMNNLYTLNLNEDEISGTNAEFRDYIQLTEPIYIDKNNDNFVGCNVIISRNYSIDLAVDNVVDEETKDPNKPIYVFRNEIKTNWWEKFKNIFSGRDDDISLNTFGYLNDNIFYVNNNNDGDNKKTRFLLPSNFYLSSFSGDITIKSGAGDNPGKTLNKESFIDDIVSLVDDEVDDEYNGNIQISKPLNYQVNNLPEITTVIDIWTNSLVTQFESIETTLFDPNERKLASILILSNFGYTLSPFNKYPYQLNSNVFGIPSVVQIPFFLSAYIGSLVDIKISDDDETYQKLRDFFIGGAGDNLQSGGIFIFADIADIINSLSENDKQNFRDAYDFFMSPTIGYFDNIIQNLQLVYEEYINIPVEGPERSDFLRNAFSETYYDVILQPLMRNTYLLNYSENTFKKKKISPKEYVAMSDLNNNYESYFNIFFSELEKLLSEKNSDEEKREIEAKKLTGDVDIINQTYYSFKNINDKWMTNPQNRKPKGYPYNEPNGSLIDLFAFVDRAMNPAGDTVINPEILADLMDDPNVSLYGVLSQLLSSNGFEFFPLQNFMSFESNNAWEDSFKIDVTGNVDNSPNFVCMYIGGASRYITGINKLNNFVDDGIVDLSGPGLGKDFVKSNRVQDNPEDDNQKNTNTRFPWGDVRAFRVKFAQQNQSMFKDFNIESKEFPETNESIEILSRLAGDNRANAPVPKGQNLYNLYENRAYSATITGLGNMMIQPTQYFQLENVPLYNGAYMILSVEHEISANKMNTSFTGTKILKYPIPRVTNPASILGFDEGDTEQTNTGLASQADGGVSLGGGTNVNPDEAKYQSMYEQKIKE
ncbi:MAG: hypothetical protein ACOC22_00340 [bacterium]